MKYNKNDKFMNKHNNNKNIIETQLSSKQVKSSFNSIFSGLLFKSIDKRELIFISFITKKNLTNITILKKVLKIK